jgi:hypothetical protein
MIFTSCNECPKCLDCSEDNNYIKKEKSISSSENLVNGLYIFIRSEPVLEYEVLGTIKKDFLDQFSDNSSGKKFGNVIKGIVYTATDNIDFQKLISHMAELSKETYKDSEGIIFNDNLSSCEVIKFKKTGEAENHLE